jgi:hypothetical protein
MTRVVAWQNLVGLALGGLAAALILGIIGAGTAWDWLVAIGCGVGVVGLSRNIPRLSGLSR